MSLAPPRSTDEADSYSSRATLARRIPAIESLRNYSWQTLGSDTMAGLTVAAVAVPQAMAYAQIAGIPPQYGLYTAIVMTAVGALLDSSKQLINGPTNAISIAVLSALVGFSDADRIPAVILLDADGRRGANRHLAAAAGRPDALRFARGDRRLHARGRGAVGARSTQKPAGIACRRHRATTIF